jgi:hypothetical protein
MLEVATLMTVFAAEVSAPSAMLAAVLVVRIGLRAFCSGYWTEPEQRS